MHQLSKEGTVINTTPTANNEVLELAVQLFKDIYALTETWPTTKGPTFRLVMDIRRAAMAVPNDLTEGFNRQLHEDGAEFLANSREALAELENVLLTAKDHKDLEAENFTPLLTQIEKIRDKIRNLKGNLTGME
jgi:four helix bundle protein